MKSSFWRFSYREARAIALIVAVVLWAIAAVFVFATPGYRSIAGPLKGGDFVFFYTLGAAARTGDATLLYDTDRLHALQTTLLPESEPETYLPVYPPQIHLVYLPLTFLPYGAAAVLWTVIIVAVYAWVVRVTWRASRDALPDGAFVVIASAAFPPFWSLVLHGHNTIVPLLAFFFAWQALEHSRRLLAGVILGLLFLKPPFGVALAAVVLFNREWSILAGLTMSAALQLAIVVSVFDTAVLLNYVQLMREVAAVEYLIEPKPFELHSIRAVTRLVSNWLGTLLWIAASVFVLQRTLVVWRSVAPVAVRMGMLVVASVLVSPHLFLYDATVLVLPLLWIGAWVQHDPVARARLTDRFWPMVFGLYAAFLLPFARLILVQVSVLLLLWLFVILANTMVSMTHGSPKRSNALEAV